MPRGRKQRHATASEHRDPANTTRLSLSKPTLVPPITIPPSPHTRLTFARPCIHAGAGLGRPAAQADEGYTGGRLRHLTCARVLGQRPYELAARGDVELFEHLA